MAKSNVQPIRAISQNDLAEYVYAKETVERLRTSIRERIENGMPVEHGRYTATVREVEQKRVPWKRVVARLKGDGYVRQVQASTKATIVRQLHVK